MSTDVKLTALERQLAVMVGGVRQTSSIKKGLTPAHGRKSAELDGFDLNIQAVGAEIAAAKALNIYFEPHFDRFTRSREPDLQPDLGVKSTIRHNSLLLHLDEEEGKLVLADPPEHRYILVRGELVKGYLVGGWCHGAEAHDLGRLYDDNGRKPCLLIPPEKLRP